MMRAATNRAMVAKAVLMAMRVVGDKESEGGKAMERMTRVACNGEGTIDGGKKIVDEGGRQTTATRAIAMAKLTKWAMAMATRLAGNREGKGKGGKGDGNGNEGGGQQRGQGK
jgi:hypothetical protein